MKQIKLLIALLIIITIGLFIVLIILGVLNAQNTNNTINVVNTTNNHNTTVNNTIPDVEPESTELTFNTSIYEENSNSGLYSISKNIDKYFNYIKEGNNIAIEELGGNSIYVITNNVKYVVKQAYVTQNQYMSKYYTYGTLTIANGNYTAQTQEIYMILYLTAENKGYKLQTISKEEYLNRTALEQNDTIGILEGTYNKFEYEYIDNVKQMEIYLEDYSFQIFNNTENSYNLLNIEYREKRFNNLQAFVQFLNEKQGQLHNIKISQYTVDEENQNKIYKGTDQYGNYYEIIEKSYMNYEIILDNYTMLDYSNDSDENKIKLSAEKFILMLNSADYTNAYNLLEPNFKQINFPTEQDFINYVKNNFYARNIVASKDLSEDGICTVTIKDSISTQANKIRKQFKVIMGEGMSFTIEFNI